MYRPQIILTTKFRLRCLGEIVDHWFLKNEMIHSASTRKEPFESYQYDNRQASSDGGVQNNANHYQRWEKHASGASIMGRCVEIVRDICTTRQLK